MSLDDRNLSHTAIVYDVSQNNDTVVLTVIAENTGGAVATKEYVINASDGSVSNGQVGYFVAPNYDAVTYTITVNASPTEGGSASGGGSYNEGDPVTVTATSASGYRFVCWTQDGKTVNTEASYTFNVTTDRTLTAVFEQVETKPEVCKHSYVSTVTPPTCAEQGYTTQTCSKCGFKEISAIPATGSQLHGTIAISAGVFSPADGSLVAANQRITLQVTPDPGCRLTSIQIIDANGKSLQLSGSGNTYTFKMPSCDVTVYPVFSKT